jgi:hypothetical protein
MEVSRSGYYHFLKKARQQPIDKDLALLSQSRQRQVRSDEAALVEQFVAMPIRQQAPVPRCAVGRGALHSDAGGAVLGEGAVPFRAFPQAVQAPQVIEEQGAHLFGRAVQPEQINLLTLTVVGS